ncbi:MAG: glycosyltransferase [Candidatus Omnitrophica bacterium]|nr:glycosyltransferase [Candidatus Omnitrophota bacterium]
MKVLQLTTHLNIGGIANYVSLVSRALKARKFECVVASAGGDLEAELAGAGIAHRKINIRTKSELSPKVIIAALQVARIVRKEKIDIIHAHTRVSQVVAAIASVITGVPFVTTCHGYFKKRLRGLFDTWGAKVIAISEAVKAHLEDDLGVRKDRIALIYSGIDLEQFSRTYTPAEMADLKRSVGLNEGPVAGNIGRLSPVKGQEFFLAAMAEVLKKRPDAQALIIGNGPDEAALKAQAGSLGIEKSVRFIGANVDTHKFLSIMDVFVFPSVKEGLGIGLLEALASGRACVASSVGGINDIVTDNVNGLLAGVGDAKAIAGSVVRLLDDPALRERLGQNGQSFVKRNFTLERMGEGVTELYRDVKKKKAGWTWKRTAALIAALVVTLALGASLFLKNAYVLPVLMYHYIDNNARLTKLSVAPKSFEKQMEYLYRNRYNVVGPDKVIDYLEKKERIPPRTVAITFDDGAYNNYKYAYPVLKKYKFPAAIFMITSKIGERGWLGWKDLKEMSDSGLITIGSHTKGHVWLPDLGTAGVKKELEESKRILEEGLGKKVDYFCYPLGAYNERIKKLVKEAGYRGAFGTNPGIHEPNDDVYAIKRVRISRTSDDLRVFWVETSGYYTWIKERRDD